MIPYYIIFALILCVIGLLYWNTRSAKKEGGEAVKAAIMQKALYDKTEEAKKLAEPARSWASVLTGLRNKSK